MARKILLFMIKYVRLALLRGCLILVRLYQLFISPLKPNCCRFTPTCSAYAKDAFLLHGLIKGAMLTLKRILRCHPWGGSGYDPVPPRKEKCIQKKEEK